MSMHKRINKQFLRTSKDGQYPHDHFIEIDVNGNGRTLETSSGPTHAHLIRRFYVESDGAHNHEVTEETKELLKSLPKETK